MKLKKQKNRFEIKIHFPIDMINFPKLVVLLLGSNIQGGG